MKYLFSFFAAFYLLTRTCYGRNVQYLHVAFVSNVVDPNDYEMETLMKLTTYPFIKGTNSSLMTRFGLVVNYSMIFTGEPDKIFTLRGLDMDRYSPDYFYSLAKNETRNSCNGTSLKGLRKALEIASEPSIILMATNRKARDSILLVEILETMIAKVNPVIVFQIEDDGSISEIPSKNQSIRIDSYIPQEIKRNKEKLLQEYSAITDVSGELLDAMNREAWILESNALQVPNMLATIPKMNYKFTRHFAKRNFVFVYDVSNTTQNELDEIAWSMRTYFQSRNSSVYNISDQYYVIFSFQPGVTVTIDKSSNYTTKDIRTMIQSQIAYDDVQKPSLKGLQKALQMVPAFSWILYYAKTVPTDDHELLPEVIQLINDKKVQIKIVIVGDSWTNSSGNPLPVLYRTIIDASKMSLSISPTVLTNWIEAINIPKIPDSILKTRYRTSHSPGSRTNY